jgi:hypothetical protein
MWGVFNNWSLGTRIGAVVAIIGFGLGAVIGIAAAGWVGVVFVAAFVALFAGAYGYAYAPEVRRNRLARTGVSTVATILAVGETGWTLQSNYGIARLRLQVEPVDGGQPYEVATRAIVDRFDVPAYQPGQRIGILVDPRDPRRVAVAASG